MKRSRIHRLLRLISLLQSGRGPGNVEALALIVSSQESGDRRGLSFFAPARSAALKLESSLPVRLREQLPSLADPVPDDDEYGEIELDDFVSGLQQAAGNGHHTATVTPPLAT